MECGRREASVTATDRKLNSTCDIWVKNPGLINLITCAICGGEFVARNSKQIACSTECRRKRRCQMIMRWQKESGYRSRWLKKRLVSKKAICIFCGKEFVKQPRRNQNHQKTCSDQCSKKQEAKMLREWNRTHADQKRKLCRDWYRATTRKAELSALAQVMRAARQRGEKLDRGAV